MPNGTFPKIRWIAGISKLKCQQSNLIETFAGIAALFLSPFPLFKQDENVNLWKSGLLK